MAFLLGVIVTTYDTWDDPPKTYCSPPVSAAPLEGFPKSLSLVFLEVAVAVEVSPGIDYPLGNSHISQVAGKMILSSSIGGRIFSIYFGIC